MSTKIFLTHAAKPVVFENKIKMLKNHIDLTY